MWANRTDRPSLRLRIPVGSAAPSRSTTCCSEDPAISTTVPIRVMSLAIWTICGTLRSTNQMISHRPSAASLSANTDCEP